MDYQKGDEIDVVIDRDGLGDDQGIGHIDDTMVVIVGAGGMVGECIHAKIISLEKLRLGSSLVASVEK